MLFSSFPAGCWFSPAVTGSTPPPCGGFSFTKISEKSVVMLGGKRISDPQHMNDIYMLILPTLVRLSLSLSV